MKAETIIYVTLLAFAAQNTAEELKPKQEPQINNPTFTLQEEIKLWSVSDLPTLRGELGAGDVWTAGAAVAPVIPDPNETPRERRKRLRDARRDRITRKKQQRGADGGYIVNGKDVEASVAPFQAALLVMRDGFFYHVCGGTLISPGAVLTAAHCIGEGTQYYVVMGLADLSDGTDPNLQFTSVSRVVKHESYSSQLEYDVALLRLAVDMTPTRWVKPMRLAPWTQTRGTWSLRCYVSGWGQTSGTQRGGSLKLKRAKFRLLRNSMCIDFWSNEIPRSQAISLIGDNEVCSQSTKSSPCFGDSGGPLTCGKYLVGVVSWGSPTCKLGVPAVYSRVSSYRTWIEQKLKTL